MAGRVFLIGGLSALAVLILLTSLVGLAALNLGRIIESNRSYLISAASDALGRRVSIRSIKARIGWGMLLVLEDVSIAEDPAFASTAPFFHAASISGRIRLLPLLAGYVEIERLELGSAQIRLMRDAQGHFNFATLRMPAAKPLPTGSTDSFESRVEPIALWSQVGSAGLMRIKKVTIDSLSATDGEVVYSDELYAVQIVLHKVELDLEPLDLEQPLNLAMRLALLGDKQNVRIDGRVGPLLRNGKLDFAAGPLALAVVIGPLVPDKLKTASLAAKETLGLISVPDPISLTGSLSGSLGAPAMRVSTDLSQARVLYGTIFAKPLGIPFKLELRAQQEHDGLSLSALDLTLASLHATGHDFSFAPGQIAGNFQIERFDLSPWNAMLPALKEYRLSGFAEAQARAALQDARLLLNGVLKLTQVTAMPQIGGAGGLSDLDAVVEFTGNSARLEPANFKLGSAHITLKGHADSLNPLRAVYALSSPQLSAADLMTDRAPQQYQARAIAASGELAADLHGSVAATTSLTSSDGRLNGVPYRDLKLKASYDAGELRVQSITMNAYDGAIEGSGTLTLDDGAFGVNIKAAGVDLAKLIERRVGNGNSSVRGRLTGETTVFGHGATFAQIEPTLRGNGRFEVVKGSIPGINPAAALLKSLSDIPGLGRVFAPDLVARYPQVFRSSDMEFESASATCKIVGQQLSSQDIKVIAADYTIVGNGWVNLDQRVNIAADIILSPPFSRDLMQHNEVLALMADGLSQVHLPLTLSGTLTKANVRPDISAVVQRIQPGAIENLGKKLLHNLFK
jgi:uncharacterized protein involved in outer membrane biogenesis